MRRRVGNDRDVGIGVFRRECMFVCRGRGAEILGSWGLGKV